MILTRERAALALDGTLDLDSRGPKTAAARAEVATWLDMGGKVTARLRTQVAWLLSLAR